MPIESRNPRWLPVSDRTSRRVRGRHILKNKCQTLVCFQLLVGLLVAFGHGLIPSCCIAPVYHSFLHRTSYQPTRGQRLDPPLPPASEPRDAMSTSGLPLSIPVIFTHSHTVRSRRGQGSRDGAARRVVVPADRGDTSEEQRAGVPLSRGSGCGVQGYSLASHGSQVQQCRVLSSDCLWSRKPPTCFVVVVVVVVVFVVVDSPVDSPIMLLLLLLLKVVARAALLFAVLVIVSSPFLLALVRTFD